MSKSPSAIALGFFDGVHIAHQKIIKYTVDYAKENNLRPIVLSFDVSPSEVLFSKKARYITTLDEKKKIIEAMGAEAEILPVSQEFLNMSPEDFVQKILVEKYNIKHAVCGYNYRFGKNAGGDAASLDVLGKQYGFTLKVLGCETLMGENVSSSRIRELISEGEIKKANLLLGRNFSVSGIVSEGKHLGRTLGFPTANVFIDNSTVIPKNGVYKTLVFIDNICYNSITNTGINPTVGGEKLRTETYIPNFQRNLYGKEIKLSFLEFIRPEKRFEDISKLKEQIRKDIEYLEK